MPPVSPFAVALALAAPLAGCIGPKLARCAVQCDSDGVCPAGLTCNSADQFCHDSSDEPLCGAGDDAGSGDGGPADASTALDCSQLDLLFVVDDTASMDLEQTSLRTAIPGFVAALDAHLTADDEPLDYRIGVISTSRDITYTEAGVTDSYDGDNGALFAPCGPTTRWLERTDPTVATTLQCRLDVGTDSAPIEMIAYAIELAFTARVDDATNAGFRRDNALLGVIVVTDEDDCSRRDDNFSVPGGNVCPSAPELFSTAAPIELLDQVTGDRTRWALAVMSGPSTGTCTTTFASATAAPRLTITVGSTGDGARQYSVCDDPATTLAAVLAQFTAACEAAE